MPNRIRSRALLVLVVLGLPLLSSCKLFFPERAPGEKLWRKHCADCHGIDARGNTPQFMGNSWADLTDESFKSGGDEHSLGNTIRAGVFPEMPEFTQLSDAEVRAIVGWLLHLRGEAR